ncbi:hypothetical protein GBA52_024379 [Prunus armeniaca]|nr:hypothetical protein GBA52_024379 [Prunus armeniaca]
MHRVIGLCGSFIGFCDVLQDCGLISISSIGSSYTWSNRRLWNRNVFGNINKRIKAVKNEMAEVRALCQPSRYLPHLKCLDHTLDTLLEKEEIF